MNEHRYLTENLVQDLRDARELAALGEQNMYLLAMQGLLPLAVAAYCLSVRFLPEAWGPALGATAALALTSCGLLLGYAATARFRAFQPATTDELANELFPYLDVKAGGSLPRFATLRERPMDFPLEVHVRATSHWDRVRGQGYPPAAGMPDRPFPRGPGLRLVFFGLLLSGACCLLAFQLVNGPLAGLDRPLATLEEPTVPALLGLGLLSWFAVTGISLSLAWFQGLGRADD